jgi:hypothetical protein
MASRSTIVITKLNKKTNEQHENDKENMAAEATRPKRQLTSFNEERATQSKPKHDGYEVKKTKITSIVVEEEQSYLDLFETDKIPNLEKLKPGYKSNLDLIDDILTGGSHQHEESSGVRDLSVKILSPMLSSTKMDKTARNGLDESSKAANNALFDEDEEIEYADANKTSKKKAHKRVVIKSGSASEEEESKLDESRKKDLNESSKIYDFKSEKGAGVQSEQESESVVKKRGPRTKRVRYSKVVTGLSDDDDDDDGDESKPKLLKTKKKSGAKGKAPKTKRLTKKQIEQNKKSEETEKFLIEQAKELEEIKKYKLIVETVERDYDY